MTIYEIIQLYGNQFYLFENNFEPDTLEKENSLIEVKDEGNHVEWKLKNESSIIFLLDKTEFSNRDLTKQFQGKLKEFEINLKKVGFGVVSQPIGIKTIELMPLPIGIYFNTEYFEKYSGIENNKFTNSLYFTYSLNDLLMEVNTNELEVVMKLIKTNCH